ncbi:bifunctional nuclease family protein [Parabacteroides sp. PF5-6]|uniref:bifunctional nuclease family protein n=1 Tax=Parabacteroides sp. PF5-6 TaxID=1742403 RepID=UPI002405061A|nr:bifunctional nuclease family protein [Parabacteroides sp. PF5-6]MDF9829738.1 bifunctional DNase/RNase [Parabacteroides sp. PF5-6]
MDTRIELRVQGLTNSQIQSGAYALILAEENGLRRIPIIVGTAEAQSIAIALEQIIPPRPLTHDLFASFSRTLGVELKEVFIYKFEDGVFYSELLFSDGVREIRLDSRTSDAIAIALRMKCRIYTTEAIVRECGVVLDESQDTIENEEGEALLDELDAYLLDLEPEDLKGEEELGKWLSLLDKESLQERLEEAIIEENYEYAKMYKDELHKREEEERTL